MKRLTLMSALFLAFLALSASFSPATAETMDFPDYSIELRPGWTVVRDSNSTAFVADDKSAIMQVTVESIARMFKEGMSARELAKAFAEEFHGSEPVMEDNDPNYYSFTFAAPDGRDSEASIVVAGGRFYLITITGKHPDLAGMVESVLLSIQ